MARRAFYSFHYLPDNFRAAQVRNMGVIEGNIPATDNDWEAVKKGGDVAIQKWIDNQLNGKSVAIVLIGSATAGRKWINYEIKAAWIAGKGVMGIYIHNLKDTDGKQSSQGTNPFSGFDISGTSLSSIVKAYAPLHSDSKLAVTVHPMHSFGTSEPRRWAAIVSARNSSARRPCNRSV